MVAGPGLGSRQGAGSQIYFLGASGGIKVPERVVRAQQVRGEDTSGFQLTGSSVATEIAASSWAKLIGV